MVAVLAQRFKRHSTDRLPSLRGQVLFYPLLQYFDMRTASYQQYYHEYAGTAVSLLLLLMSDYFTDTGLLDPRAIGRAFLAYMSGNVTEHLVEQMLNNKHTTRRVFEDVFLSLFVPARCNSLVACAPTVA